jgi:hypothetical protein
MENKTFQQLFGINHKVEVRINLTNICNLHCDFCDHDAHLPIQSSGSKIYRKKPIVSTIDEIEKLLRSLKGVGENERHVLQGGEITVLPVNLVSQVIDIMHSYGRNVGIRTNGYNIKGIPLSSLNKLEFIYLNDHDNNREAIEFSKNYLSKHYNGIIIDEKNHYHRDLSKYLHHKEGTIEEGLSCSHLLSTLTFFPPLVHPCCNSWALMNALNNESIADCLISAGWTTSNPDLLYTLENWRTTLPKRFLKVFCAESCYLTAKTTESPLQKISSHMSDKVLKKNRDIL